MQEAVLDKSSQRIGRMFDDITPTYDLLNHILSMSIDLGWRERMIEELEVGEGDTVLDIATGTGDMAILARSRTDCSVVGVDLSRNMLGQATLKWDRRFGEGYQAMQGDALHLPLRDASFDKAMVAFGVRNMADIPAFIREVGRVLKPQGWLAILEFSLPPYPVVREAYLVYLTKVLPFIGGLQSGNRSAYQYLSASIRRFPSPESLTSLIQDQGFQVRRSISLSMGICHLYVIERM